MLASIPVLQAGMRTLHLGLVAIRNGSLRKDGDFAFINALAESLHELPVMLNSVDSFRGGESEMLEVLRVHLSGIDEGRFPQAPKLLEIFERELNQNQSGV